MDDNTEVTVTWMPERWADVRRRVLDRNDTSCSACDDTSPDPEGAVAAQLAPESDTARDSP